MQWTSGGKPIKPGVYAIHYCWDTEEGSFIGVDLWDGVTWDDQFPVIEFAGPFTQKSRAF
jgi:hypothetical protein